HSKSQPPYLSDTPYTQTDASFPDSHTGPLPLFLYQQVVILPCQVNGIADLVPVPDLRLRFDSVPGIQSFPLPFGQCPFQLSYPVSQPVVLVLRGLPGPVHS